MTTPALRVLGIDPGLANTGWGVLENREQDFRMLESGCIVTLAEETMPRRLKQIQLELQRVVEQYRPDAVAVEQLFFAKNTKTALKVAQARGVAILAATATNAPLFEYTPLQVKQAVAGRGRAGKEQVQRMVEVILQLSERKNISHISDALAVAICHCNFAKFHERESR